MVQVLQPGAKAGQRAWRVGLVVLAVAAVAGVTAGFAFVGGAVPDRPCPKLNSAEISARRMSFVNSFASSRNRVNDVLIRAENGQQIECVQVWDRARCVTDGPRSVRVMVRRHVEHFAIPAGERATLRATPDGIACGIEAA